MPNTDIKIFISCHKECTLLKNKYVYPIQVGSALSSKRFPNMLHDDIGDNISALNPMYCELTAQYWAWKNVDADYYGFMHYRRYFSFNTVRLPEDPFGNIVLKNITEDNIEKLRLNEHDIEKFVPNYDVITLIPNDMKSLGSNTVFEHAKDQSPYHRIEDLEEIINIINQKYPEFNEATKKYLNSSKGYFCNMYILKKDIFKDYCSWLFDILETHRKSKSFDDYSIDEYRVSGFWAERLWGIYLTYLLEHHPSLKYKEIQKTFFENTSDDLNITPAFSLNNVPVIFAADNNYVPIVSAALKSLVDNGTKQNNYDIIILNQNISELNQIKIKNAFSTSNCSVRFINVKEYFENRDLVTPAHFTIEIYFRLVMPDVLKHYDKVIYLDSDLIIAEDIANLYNIDIGNNLVAAVQDVDSAGCYKEFDPSRKKYFDDIMQLKDPYSYFNSGVLIMNLAEFRKTYSTEYILKMAESKDYIFPDQDVLNKLCEKRTFYLDSSWNTMMNHQDNNNSRLKVAKMAPRKIYLDYIEARKHPKIIHYAGYQKPWQYFDCDMSEYFWKYACQTSFWENLLLQGIQRNINIAAPVSTSATVSSPTMAWINGISEPIYLDGVMIKFINFVNKALPIGSAKRNFIKKIARFFLH